MTTMPTGIRRSRPSSRSPVGGRSSRASFAPFPTAQAGSRRPLDRAIGIGDVSRMRAGGMQDAFACTAVHLEPRLLEDEVLGVRGRRLGLAQHEVAAFAEREREQLEGALLELGREVDEDVAAQREVDPRERRPLAEVVLAEHHEGPDLLVDLVLVAVVLEPAGEEVGVDRAHRAGRIAAAPGERDRLLVQVGREDPDREAGQLAAEDVRDEDRQRVRLLAGRAAGGPDPELPVAGPRLVDELRDERLAQVLVQVGVAEELGHLDEERARQPLVLLGMLLDVADVVAEARVRRRDHPPLEPAHHRGPLVRAEVDACPLPDCARGTGRATARRPRRAARWTS